MPADTADFRCPFSHFSFSHPPFTPNPGVRNAYASHSDGAVGYYTEQGAGYSNPHDGGVLESVHDAIRAWPDLFKGTVVGDVNDENGERVLDLSCGSGEVTDALLKAGIPVERIDACDPYTGEAYKNRIKKQCNTWSFEDIARGDIAEKKWKTIICSFAMHLCDDGYLPTLVLMLAVSCDSLIILTPHKRPELDPKWGFKFTEERKNERWRIRTRRYNKA
mgnify:CR=1 FL=1|tara:strand:+ start:9405 stop:10064 length:660 start_codon:yes stop_codon:yes gene_type:complete